MPKLLPLAVALGFAFAAVVSLASLRMAYELRSNQAGIRDRLSGIESTQNAVLSDFGIIRNDLGELRGEMKKLRSELAELRVKTQGGEGSNAESPIESVLKGGAHSDFIDSRRVQNVGRPFLFQDDLDPDERSRFDNSSLLLRNTDGSLSYLRVRYKDGSEQLREEDLDVAMEILRLTAEMDYAREDYVDTLLSIGDYHFESSRDQAVEVANEDLSRQCSFRKHMDGYAVISMADLTTSETYVALKAQHSSLMRALGAVDVATLVLR